jgi:hypothetical protein
VAYEDRVDDVRSAKEKVNTDAWRFEQLAFSPASFRSNLQSIRILGSGPIVIGQAAEFDYSGTRAVRALHEEGYRVILVNSNPPGAMFRPIWRNTCSAAAGSIRVRDLLLLRGMSRSVGESRLS